MQRETLKTSVEGGLFVSKSCRKKNGLNYILEEKQLKTRCGDARQAGVSPGGEGKVAQTKIYRLKPKDSELNRSW